MNHQVEYKQRHNMLEQYKQNLKVNRVKTFTGEL